MKAERHKATRVIPPTPAPLILTLKLPRDAHARLDAERTAHFPADRLQVGAHVTLFHHLPGPQAPEIAAHLASEVRHHAPFEVRVASLRFLGRGTAYALESRPLHDLREALARHWEPLLIPQDAQGFRPHVTVANKLDGAKAKALHAQLLAGFRPWSFVAAGVQLHRYDGGPWTMLGEWAFRR